MSAAGVRSNVREKDHRRCFRSGVIGRITFVEMPFVDSVTGKLAFQFPEKQTIRKDKVQATLHADIDYEMPFVV